MTNVWSKYGESRLNGNGKIDLIPKHDLLMHVPPLENQFLCLDFSNENHNEETIEKCHIKFYQFN